MCGYVLLFCSAIDFFYNSLNLFMDAVFFELFENYDCILKTYFKGTETSRIPSVPMHA